MTLTLYHPPMQGALLVETVEGIRLILRPARRLPEGSDVLTGITSTPGDVQL